MDAEMISSGLGHKRLPSTLVACLGLGMKVKAGGQAHLLQIQSPGQIPKQASEPTGFMRTREENSSM